MREPVPEPPVGANALARRTAPEDIAEFDTERGYRIRRFIQDRTVIEDTESTIDLIARGWRLHNYPERLAFSATPQDFGSLIIQRRRDDLSQKLHGVSTHGSDQAIPFSRQRLVLLERRQRWRRENPKLLSFHRPRQRRQRWIQHPLCHRQPRLKRLRRSYVPRCPSCSLRRDRGLPACLGDGLQDSRVRVRVVNEKTGRRKLTQRMHDLRRTAARDRVDDGTPERVVMAMTGHKTRGMFDRYSIASTKDIEAALRKATLPAGNPVRQRNPR